MRKDNWRFEALARGRIARQEEEARIKGHTPGPWIIREENEWLCIRPANNPQGLISGNISGTYAAGWQGSESIANARLIAAAPDLLEACKALISNAVWDGKTREHGSANEYTVHRAVIEAAQRAIKLTEGREPNP